MASVQRSNQLVPEGAIYPLSFRMWKSDTRSIVGAILLAVCFSVNMQFTERLDTATTGGIIPWLGLMFVNLWFPAACLFFGMTGALIVANFNPIIAVLTATGPLAPAWFAANTAWTVPFTFIVAAMLRNQRHLTLRQFYVACGVSQLGSAGILLAVWVFLLKLPPMKVLGLAAWAVAMCIPGAIMGYYFCRSIAKSGIAD